MNKTEQLAVKEADSLFYEYVDNLEKIAIKHKVDKNTFIVAALTANFTTIINIGTDEFLKVKNMKVGKINE